MRRCPKCQLDYSEDARFCTRCGRPFTVVGAEDSGGAVAPWLLAGAVMVLLAFVLLGNFRFVSGAPGMLVKRQYFGFDEPFATVADCTSAPWIVASAQHGPLCSDLQAAGILESDADRELRIQREVSREMEQMQAEIMRQQQEMQAEMMRQQRELMRSLGQ